MKLAKEDKKKAKRILRDINTRQKLTAQWTGKN